MVPAPTAQTARGVPALLPTSPGALTPPQLRERAVKRGSTEERLLLLGRVGGPHGDGEACPGEDTPSPLGSPCPSPLAKTPSIDLKQSGASTLAESCMQVTGVGAVRTLTRTLSPARTPFRAHALHPSG